MASAIGQAQTRSRTRVIAVPTVEPAAQSQLTGAAPTNQTDYQDQSTAQQTSPCAEVIVVWYVRQVVPQAVLDVPPEAP